MMMFAEIFLKEESEVIMMKKRLLATTFALALVIASPVTSVTTHAADGLGWNVNAHDDTNYGERPSAYWSNGSSTSSGSGSSSSSSSSSRSSNSSSSSSSSHSDASGSGSDSGSVSYVYSEDGEMHVEYSAPEPVGDANWAAVNANSNDTKATAGKEAFRSVMSGDHKAYDIYHKGVSVATFIVAGEDGKAVQYNNVTVKAGDDGLYYAEITMPAGVDTTGMTVALTKGDASYLSITLGITGIKLNGEIVFLTAAQAE